MLASDCHEESHLNKAGRFVFSEGGERLPRIWENNLPENDKVFMERRSEHFKDSFQFIHICARCMWGKRG